MYEQRTLVTGNWDNIVAMIRAMFAAGLCRVEHVAREQYEATRIVLGDDSEVRAYYARMTAEREALRERAIQAGAAGNSGLACALFQQSDELLCRYQERSACVRERPFDLSQNIYGWCIGSMLLSNLYGGRFAWSNRGATLEECIRYGCELSRNKGTSLTFDVEQLPVSPEERVALVRDLGAPESAIAFLLTWAERKAAKDREIEAARVRCAEMQAQRVQEQAVATAFEPTRQATFAAVRTALVADGAVVQVDRGGCTVRGTTFNPSFRLTVSHTGWRIERTDFDGVRKEHSNVAFGAAGTPEEITAAALAAWTAMKPAKAARKTRRAS